MIPTKPPPTFKDADRWSKEFLDFVSKCLVKNPEDRASATQLLQVRQKGLFLSFLENLADTKRKFYDVGHFSSVFHLLSRCPLFTTM